MRVTRHYVVMRAFFAQKQALRFFRSDTPVATIFLLEACAKTHDFAHAASIVQDLRRFQTRPHAEDFQSLCFRFAFLFDSDCLADFGPKT